MFCGDGAGPHGEVRCPAGRVYLKGAVPHAVRQVSLSEGSRRCRGLMRLMEMKSIRNTSALLLDRGLPPLIIYSGVPLHQSSSFLISSSG